jgi:xanthine/CO dehydrogenase XdhC/CoxF family maturation factor
MATEVVPQSDPKPSYAFSSAAVAQLAQELVRRGMGVTSGAGWSVVLPDGTDVGVLVRPLEPEDNSVRLCRLALVGVWVYQMRTRPLQPPEY